MTQTPQLAYIVDLRELWPILAYRLFRATSSLVSIAWYLLSFLYVYQLTQLTFPAVSICIFGPSLPSVSCSPRPAPSRRRRVRRGQSASLGLVDYLGLQGTDSLPLRQSLSPVPTASSDSGKTGTTASPPSGTPPPLHSTTPTCGCTRPPCLGWAMTTTPGRERNGAGTKNPLVMAI